MCHPAAIAAASGLSSAGLSIMGARSDVRLSEQARRSAEASAQRAYAMESASNQLSLEETRQQVTSAGVQNKIDAARAQGAAITEFGSTGVGGQALDSVVNEYARQQGQAQGGLSQSLTFAGQNSLMQLRAAHESTINKTRIENPRRKLGGLQIASAALGGLTAGVSAYTPSNPALDSSNKAAR